MNKILEIKAGSHLYGLTTKDSDEDFFGIYIDSLDEVVHDFYYGIQKGREVDLSVIDKDGNGKNSKDAVDRKFFSLKKYAIGALNCNPNIIECLYADEDSIVYRDEIGKRLMENRHLFMSKAAYYSFKQYARKQVNKAETKTPKHRKIKACLAILEEKIDKSKLDLIDYMREPWFEEYFDLGKLSYRIKGTSYELSKGLVMKRAIKEVKKIYDSMTNRRELVDKFGYDSKFYSHNVRLLIECRDILLDGKLIFPIRDKDRELIMSIKEGKVSKEEIEKIIAKCELDVEEAFKVTKLPAKPNFDAVDKLIKEIYTDAIFGGCQCYG